MKIFTRITINYYRLPIYGVYVYYSGQHSTTETAVAATVLRKMMIPAVAATVLRKMMIQGGNGVFIVKHTTAQATSVYVALVFKR
jgi:hypothetical protein